MNINDSDLKRLFLSHIMEKRPASRHRCLTGEAIIAIFDPDAKRKLKKKAIDHVTNCGSCAQEFESILAIKRETQNFESEIEKLFSDKAPAYSDQKPKIGRIRVTLNIWQYAAMAAGIFFLSASFFILIQQFHSPFLKYPEVRVNPRPEVRLIAPVRGPVFKNDLLFKWEAVDIADFYVLELYDESLALVWKSPELATNSFSPPKSLLSKLGVQKYYLWMITASLKDGRVIESPLKSFKFRE